MTDEQLRLQCLMLAHQRGLSDDDAIAVAKKFADFVLRGGSAATDAAISRAEEIFYEVFREWGAICPNCRNAAVPS